MMYVAADDGPSDVALRKICLKLKIPWPKNGHWAKAAAGRVPDKLPLLHRTGQRFRRIAQQIEMLMKKCLSVFPMSLNSFPRSRLAGR